MELLWSFNTDMQPMSCKQTRCGARRKNCPLLSIFPPVKRWAHWSSSHFKQGLNSEFTHSEDRWEQICMWTKVAHILGAELQGHQHCATWPGTLMVQLSCSHDSTRCPDTWTIISKSYLWPMKQGQWNKALSWSDVRSVTVRHSITTLSSGDNDSSHCRRSF